MSRLLLLVALVQSAFALGDRYVAGHTTNDQQVYGPALKRIAVIPPYGVHIVWKGTDGYPVYNFFDRSLESWNWLNGIVPFTAQANLGNLEAGRTDLLPYIAGTTYDQGIHGAVYAVDTALSQGLFATVSYESWFDSDQNLLAISYNDRRHFCALRHDSVIHHRGGSPYLLGRGIIHPTHNIAASGTNQNMAIFWTRVNGPATGTLYLRRSTNTGMGWRDSIKPSLAIPDPLRNCFLGAYGEYDNAGNLHLVTNTWDGTHFTRSALWHYCEANTPNWSRIHAVDFGNLIGRVPGEALAAGRPSIGCDPATGELYVVWEEVNPRNIEPRTGVLRDDIWAARSDDNGNTWSPPCRITDSDETSKRYPVIAALVDGFLHIEYLVDSVAGYATRDEGPATNNPVVYHRIESYLIPAGIEDDQRANNLGPELEVHPNPMAEALEIRYSLPTGSSRMRIMDAAGRELREWSVAGQGRLLWNRRTQTGALIPRGVCFVVLGNLTRKLIVR